MSVFNFWSWTILMRDLPLKYKISVIRLKCVCWKQGTYWVRQLPFSCLMMTPVSFHAPASFCSMLASQRQTAWRWFISDLKRSDKSYPQHAQLPKLRSPHWTCYIPGCWYDSDVINPDKRINKVPLSALASWLWIAVFGKVCSAPRGCLLNGNESGRMGTRRVYKGRECDSLTNYS